MSTLLDRIAAVVGAGAVITEADAVAPYLTDWRKRYVGRALAVVQPATTNDVATVVKLCAAEGVGIVPQGGNTGLAGGATPDSSGAQIVLSLVRLQRVRAVDSINNTITVEAGCTLAAVQQAAAAAERLFPLSLAAEGSCTIGGNLSTNAGGTAVLRYGNTRELTLGLEVVLASGEVWDGLRALRKNNTGYDLKQLFIGAEGTLGVITAAVLRLFPLPRAQVTAVVGLESPARGLDVLDAAQAAFGPQLTAFELFSDFCLGLVLQHFGDCRAPFANRPPYYALLELSDSSPAPAALEALEAELAVWLGRGILLDAVVAGSAAQAQQLWSLRENISEAQAREGKNIKHDIALPISSVAAFIKHTGAELQRAHGGVRIVCFGHLGDGNLHYNISAPAGADAESFLAAQPLINRVVHDAVAACGGAISAEHGIGQLRRSELQRYKTPIELDLMRCVKAALDPSGIMNPGKVL